MNVPNTRKLLVSFLMLALAACGAKTSDVAPLPTVAPMTWQIQAGGSNNNEAVQGLEFYPASLTINAGDTVQWTFPSGEPHTVSIVPDGQTAPPPTDPSVPAPVGGTTTDGTTYTSSGFILLGKNYLMTFTKPGTYHYTCLIHAGMDGTIIVNPAGTQRSTTQQAVTAAGQAALTTDLNAGVASLASFPYPFDGTQVAAGIAPGPPTGKPAAATVLRFLSSDKLTSTSVTVHVGSSVTWTNLSNNEPHTVTFGVVGQPFPVMDPLSPAMGPSSYDGTTLVNSGVLVGGQTFTLTFTKTGSYVYHCLFHDDTTGMIGTVNVIP